MSSGMNGHINPKASNKSDDTEQQCLITDIKEIKDPMLKRNAAYFDNYARNIYRVLMSRGMKGCYVYCCDENLKEYLRAKIRDRK